MKKLSNEVTNEIINQIFDEEGFSSEKLEGGIYSLDPQLVFPDNPELWEETTVLPATAEKGVVIGVCPYQTIYDEDGEPTTSTGEIWFFPEEIIAIGIVDKYYTICYPADSYRILKLIPDDSPIPAFKVSVDLWQDGIERIENFVVFTDDFKAAGFPEYAWPEFGYWDGIE